MHPQSNDMPPGSRERPSRPVGGPVDSEATIKIIGLKIGSVFMFSKKDVNCPDRVEIQWKSPR